MKSPSLSDAARPPSAAPSTRWCAPVSSSEPRIPTTGAASRTEAGREQLAQPASSGSGLANRLERLAHSELRAIERAIEILERV